MQDGQTVERAGDGGREAVADGDIAQDVAVGGVAPAAFAFGFEALAQVCRPSANAEHVRRAAVFGFVDGVGAGAVGGRIEVLRGLFQPAAFDGALVGSSASTATRNQLLRNFFMPGILNA